MKIVTLQFNLKLFALLTVGFIFCTIIGTVSHEAGHCIAAKAIGYKTTLSYAYMDVSQDDPKEAALKKYYRLHKEKIITQKSSPEATRFARMLTKYEDDRCKISLGGPLQTITTGTFGFLMLFFNRRRIYSYGMKAWDWVFMLLAFFWSRQLFNFLTGVYLYLHKGRIGHSDETRLAKHYRLPYLTIDLVGALISVFLLSYLVFKIIPVHHRLTFILSGIAGSSIGWLIWMDLLGPIALP